MKLTRVHIITLLLLLATLPIEAQCAMCRAVLESEEDGVAAAGINNGIIYLMVFPYLLIGGVGYIIFRMVKKSRSKKVS